MFDSSRLCATDVMTREVISVAPDATLMQAAQLMLDHGIGALPVLKDGRLLGIVSEADLVRPDEIAEDRARWWLDMLAEGDELSPEYLAAIHERNRPVSKVMQTDVVTVTELTPLRDVAKLIARNNIRRVLVVEGDQLRGIVARRDLVKALAKGG
ncbi:CBS domain-containing protein [Rhodovastum atsumiense]|uniref:CBS domain-containing protein n=1 Tax=Rhodovastum atsumiense TaxID=504468 RepID=A0A5M6IRZ7_9PROT|nr:CBS domain-containing protein [Rhodovastum atsumiense]KAA5610348.1 CBS domain-containing protein [Rhodovastum atsumiense]CAH2600910.1 CBS domain-containing protein [Rhodovastum atsumiense]